MTQYKINIYLHSVSSTDKLRHYLSTLISSSKTNFRISFKPAAQSCGTNTTRHVYYSEEVSNVCGRTSELNFGVECYGVSWCSFGTFKEGGGDPYIGGVTVDVWDPRPELSFIEVLTREGTHQGGMGIGLSLICWSQYSALFNRYPRPCSARSLSSNIGSFSRSITKMK